MTVEFKLSYHDIYMVYKNLFGLVPVMMMITYVVRQEIVTRAMT